MCAKGIVNPQASPVMRAKKVRKSQEQKEEDEIQSKHQMGSSVNEFGGHTFVAISWLR